MYQFILIYPKNTEGPIHINGHYITKVYSRQKVTHLDVQGFPTIQIHDSKYKILRLLKLNPAQQGKKIKVDVPALLKKKIKLDLSRVVYVRPVGKGKTNLTLSGKESFFILFNPESFLNELRE